MRLTWGTGIAAVLFAISAVGKLIEPQHAINVLVTVWGVGAHLAPGFVLLLAAAELTVGALCLALTRLPVRATACVALVVLSISPARQLVQRSQIGCGCGISFAMGSPALDQSLALARNLSVAVLLLVEGVRRPLVVGTSRVVHPVR